MGCADCDGEMPGCCACELARINSKAKAGKMRFIMISNLVGLDHSMKIACWKSIGVCAIHVKPISVCDSVGADNQRGNKFRVCGHTIVCCATGVYQSRVINNTLRAERVPSNEQPAGACLGIRCGLLITHRWIQPVSLSSSGLFLPVREDRSDCDDRSGDFCIFYYGGICVRISVPCIGNHRDIRNGDHVPRTRKEKSSAFRRRQSSFSFVIPCWFDFDPIIVDDSCHCLLPVVR